MSAFTRYNVPHYLSLVHLIIRSENENKCRKLLKTEKAERQNKYYNKV